MPMQYWGHRVSGEVVAVQLDGDGTVLGYTDTLDYRDVTAEGLESPANWADFNDGAPGDTANWNVLEAPYSGDRAVADDLISGRLYGIAEIAEALDEDRQTVAKWRERGQLPQPSQELAMGPVWTADAIEPWIQQRREAVRVKELVGYHNYFRMDVFEAAKRVSERCPAGWRATYQSHNEPMPPGAIRVGQVKVHHGDPAFPLYVYPIPAKVE